MKTYRKTATVEAKIFAVILTMIVVNKNLED